VLRSTVALRKHARVLAVLPFEHPCTAANTSALQAESGIGLLTAEQLVEVLDFAVAAPAGTELSAGVVDVDRFVAVCQRLAPRALLTELGSATGPADNGDATLRAELAGLNAGRRAERVLDLVLAATGAALGLSPHEVAPDTGFFDLGLDSIIALALKTQLEHDTGTELPATLTFELPTPRKLARHLAALLEPSDAPATDGEPSGAGQPADRAEPFGWPERQAAAESDELDVTEATDDELLRLLSQATASAHDLLQEASQW
jgi:acyl carrier protein